MTTHWGTTRYEYDLLNRMKSVISPDGDTTEYFYNPVGNRDSVDNWNGVSTGYTYDDLNRLTKVTNYGSGGVISSYEYVLNNAGIRTAVIEDDNSRVDYGYDDLYRLTSETRTGSNVYGISYTYDNVGNRLTKDHDGVITDYIYNIRDQLETEVNPSETITYTYDASGRQLTKTEIAGVTTYKWVDGDRLDSVITPTKTIIYTYDADDSKVSMSDGSVNKNYLVDKLQPYAQVVAEYDDSQILVSEYVYGLERISQDRSGNVHIYIADGQGSIRQLTNTQGNITDTYDYFAFGEVLNKTGTTENEFQYVGEQVDLNSNFYYLRARWMNPNSGRFVSVDPFGGYQQTPISLHRYLYGNSSPASFYDPTGRFTLMSLMMTVSVSNILASNARANYSLSNNFSYGVGLCMRDVRLLGRETQTLLPNHHNVKVAIYYGRSISGVEMTKEVRGFFARDFWQAVREFYNPFSSGWVPGYVDTDANPGICNMSKVNKNRYLTILGRIITAPDEPYKLTVYDCRHWAAKQLR